MDAIQDGLRAWAEQGDRRRGGDAWDALVREWRPQVLRFLRGPSPEEVEDVLGEALLALAAVGREGDAPRALAPEGVDSMKAWRRKVLRHFLIDRSRKLARRRHAVKGVVEGWSPKAEREEWRRVQEDRESPSTDNPGADDPSVHRAAVAAGELSPEAITQRRELLASRRSLVMDVLPELPVRRRVVLMLALSGDPSKFAAELSRKLREDVVDVQGRIDIALHSPPFPDHERLSLERVRVCWPNSPERTARDTARRTLARAVLDAEALVGGQT